MYFLSPAAFPPHGVQSAASALAKAFGLISRYRRLKVVSPKAVGDRAVGLSDRGHGWGSALPASGLISCFKRLSQIRTDV